MSEEPANKKRAAGFNEDDQEAIANKFQKLADDRKGKTGLGFNSSAPTPTATVRTDSSSSNADAVSTQEEKTRHLKETINTLETNNAAAALQRRQAIAQIQGSSDSFNMSNGASIPIPPQEQSHYSAIFSTAHDTTRSNVGEPNPARTNHDSAPKTLFNKRTSPISADAPLYKRLKIGDTVLACFADDDKFYKADIMSIMHSGYHSAKYDVKFHGYEGVETLSWTDLREYSTLRDAKEEINVGVGDGKVDAFGRSLSERAVDSRANNSADFDGNASSTQSANAMASDQFMNNMMIETNDSNDKGPDDSSGSNRTLFGVRNVDNSTAVYEAPMSIVKFSLDNVVDPSLFASSVKGQWKSMC